MYRRGFLSTVVTLSIAGCQQPSKTRRDSQIELFVTNDTRGTKRITVTLERESGSTLFEHTYRLSAGKGDESKEVSTTPTAVRVKVSDGRTETFDYSAPLDCDRPEIDIFVQPDEIQLTNGCL